MTFAQQIEAMKQYLLVKFEQGDWHGVSDAANDIREMLVRNATIKNENSLALYPKGDLNSVKCKSSRK